MTVRPVPTAEEPASLPRDADAERQVLGALLAGIGPDRLAEILALLGREDFDWADHRSIFEAVAGLHAEGTPIDAITVKGTLEDRGQQLHAGPLLLFEMVYELANPASALHHARRVRFLAGQRRGLLALSEAQARMRAGEDGAVVFEDLRDPLTEAGDDASRFTPLNWDELQEAGIPAVRFVREPYIAAGARIWAWGPAESGKSMWALWLCGELSRDGVHVAYFSQENPLTEDVRRLDRLRPDWTFMRFFSDQAVDLADPRDVRAVIAAARGCELIVFDTLTACWSGDENDNAAIAQLDRAALKPLASETGAAILVLHHTGHPQVFITRKGASAGRGASSMGQKADVVLEFRPAGDTTFTITHAKGRPGGRKAPSRLYQVLDTDENRLELVFDEKPGTAEVIELADRMVEAIEEAGMLTTKGLRQAVPAGRDRQTDAMHLLEMEDPPRVIVADEVIPTEGGKQRVRAWRPASASLLDGDDV